MSLIQSCRSWPLVMGRVGGGCRLVQGIGFAELDVPEDGSAPGSETFGRI